MKIPDYLVNQHILRLFNAGVSAGLSASSLLVLIALSLAANGERVNIKMLMLFTGMLLEEAKCEIQKLKDTGYVYQSNVYFSLTDLGTAKLQEIGGGVDA